MGRMTRRLFARMAGSAVVAILVLAGAAGCGSGTTTTSTSAATTVTTPTGGSTTTAAGGSLVAQGQALSVSLKCANCHTTDASAGVGPTWKGLAGSQVKLTDSTTVTADDAYLKQSIMDPDKQIVQGFQAGVMSGVIKPGAVSATDVNALVAYIDSLK
jgi:cytochrome c oxidase subunit II